MKLLLCLLSNFNGEACAGFKLELKFVVWTLLPGSFGMNSFALALFVVCESFVFTC